MAVVVGLACSGMAHAAEPWGATSAVGVVYWDQNANGARDASEAGVPGVRVTAGHAIAETDAAGGYVLTSETPFWTVSVHLFRASILAPARLTLLAENPV